MIYYLFAFADYSLEELSNCPDAVAYGELVRNFLWSHFSVILITIAGARMTLRVLQSIFSGL